MQRPLGCRPGSHGHENIIKFTRKLHMLFELFAAELLGSVDAGTTTDFKKYDTKCSNTV